jgi:hypothetical protein
MGNGAGAKALRCSSGLRPSAASALLLMALLAGCGGSERQAAVPEHLTDQATVLGLPNARFWADSPGPAIAEEVAQAVVRERVAQREPAVAETRLGAANYLVVSGGADQGAFGAGLLAGWSESGARPSFKLVTGVSTGALIAPFAFLGPSYDRQLRAVYTEITPDDVYKRRWFLPVVFNDALTSSDPLFQLISRHVDMDVLAGIAREYDKGRLLLIGTTNLDVQRPAIWNIGAIAKTGRPAALDLLRKIMLASASVPGVFPPVLIDVEAAGQRYQEMHVDGAAVTKAILIPPQIGSLVDLQQESLARDRRAYIIFNARLDPEWAPVDRRLLSITRRAIATMIHYGGYNDVLRIHATSQRNGIDYNLAYIDDKFAAQRKTLFDPGYMRSLFDYGYEQGRVGYAWRKTPPILAEPGG